MDKIFKELVNSTSPSLKSSLVKNLTDLYEHYELEYENSLTLDEVKKHLHKIIRDNLAGDQLNTSEVFILKDQLLLAHFVKGQHLQPYLGILEIIVNAVRERDSNSHDSRYQLVGYDAKDKWHIALQAALDLTVISPKLIEYDLQNLRRVYRRQFTVSCAAKLLQAEGCKVDIEGGRVTLEESQARQMVSLIEADIRLLGGIEALKRLFKVMEPCFHAKQERYHLGRTFNSLFQAEFPSIPFNYLLNLCVKHPCRQTIAIESSNDTWKRILERSIALTSILDVEPYNQFALLFHRPDTLTQFIQELAVYDNLFCPAQLRPSDVPKVLRGLFSWASENIQESLSWTPEQAAIVAEKILDLAKGKLYPVIFRSQDLKTLETQVRKSEIDKLLTVFSHKLDTVNSNLQIPQDVIHIQHEIYFHHKPLIQLSNDEYLLTNPSICAPAFYEAITTELRAKVDPKINDKLGGKIENLIKSEFLERGIKVSSGKYGDIKGGKSPDEIDLLIEASDTLIFFEVKAKTLTRRSRCGNDLNLFLDLSSSLLASQVQINKHEIFIRKNGSIFLEDGSVCDLNNRDIARVSITLLDFGSFQDRTFIFQFLENMLRGRFEAGDDVSRASSLNKKLEEFQRQFNELAQLDPQRVKHPFYNCWFLSLPQLLIILDNVTSSDNLKQELWRTRSLSTGSLDFYREYECARELAKARDAM